jgi:hypothetical protein
MATGHVSNVKDILDILQYRRSLFMSMGRAFYVEKDKPQKAGLVPRFFDEAPGV